MIEWQQAGKDWRGLAAAGGHDLETAAGVLATFERVQNLDFRGATMAQIAGETTLETHMVAEYLDIVDEEKHSSAKREAKSRLRR